MADPAMNTTNAGAIRLLSGSSQPHRPLVVDPGDLLRFSQRLSLSTSHAEIWQTAETFLSGRIGDCTIEIVELASPGEPRLQRLDDEFLGPDVNQIETTDDGCRVLLSLKYRDTVRGWIVVLIRNRIGITQEELELIELVTFTCSGDCARVENSRDFEDHMSDLSFIHRLEQQISAAPNVPSIGSTLQEELGRVIDNDLFALLVSTDDPTLLEVVAYKRSDNYGNLGFLVPVEGSKAGSVFQSGKPTLVDNVLNDEGAYARESANWRSLMIAPLMSGTKIFGVIMVGHELPAIYGERDLRIVELTANHIANAIYRLLDDEREHSQYRAIIESLSAAVDARDPFTHTHSLRVSELARCLALELGFSEEETEQIELAGLLHDIGKIGVPDSVLAKPGPLDPEERLIMMSHAALGANIIGRSPLLTGLMPMVRHHHEWFDGRGYPDGLSGDAIPLSAAI